MQFYIFLNVLAWRKPYKVETCSYVKEN